MEDVALAGGPGGAGAAGTRVAICVPSYRRPHGLLALLGALDGLQFEGEAPEIRVVVVDNDAQESAREICEEARRWLRYKLTYVVEKRKGIPPARNAAVAAALGIANWIAFIDDDELPEPRWLDQLLSVQRETAAAVVTGPVLPRFAMEPPAWVRDGGFFAPPRFETGCPRPHAFTNNVLVSTDALGTLGQLFDERFGFGVGEDTELFERLATAGHAIVWADEAVVHEVVPTERVSAWWICVRGFRNGTARTHIDRVRAQRGGGYVVTHGSWCIAKGLAFLLGTWSRHWRVEGLRLAGFGVGRLAGLAGVC